MGLDTPKPVELEDPRRDPGLRRGPGSGEKRGPVRPGDRGESARNPDAQRHLTAQSDRSWGLEPAPLRRTAETERVRRNQE